MGSLLRQELEIISQRLMARHEMRSVQPCLTLARLSPIFYFQGDLTSDLAVKKIRSRGSDNIHSGHCD